MTKVTWICLGCWRTGCVRIAHMPDHPLFLETLHAAVEAQHGPLPCMLSQVEYYDCQRRALWN